jgi:hypothetical protein
MFSGRLLISRAEDTSLTKRWKDSPGFCAFLLRMNYAEQTEKGIVPKLSVGLMAYLWEAWQAATGIEVKGWQDE